MPQQHHDPTVADLKGTLQVKETPLAFTDAANQARAERIELDGRSQFFDLRGRWSRWLIAWISGLLLFEVVLWDCMCVCGNLLRRVRSTSLVTGNTSSCGCLYQDVRPTIRLTHGDKPKSHRVAPEYTAWTNMITRCTNPKHNRWHRYGGRGIAVCERWRNSYEAFLADVGRRPRPAYSLDRFPNCDGNYEPGNVRWATDSEQALNRSKAA